MTLAPVEEVRLTYPEGLEAIFPVEALGPFCGAPNCAYRGVHLHHICPRRMTAGPKRLVVIDALVVDNAVKLCLFHHEQVTGGLGGHAARIRWTDDGWIWQTRDNLGWVPAGLIDQRKGLNA